MDSGGVTHVSDSSSQASVCAIAGSGSSFVAADADGGLQLLQLHCQ
jgi:hypothetical protein